MACIVCDKIRERKALIVYEDDSLIAVLPAKPAVPGHVKIMPKVHATKLEELDDDTVEGLFFLANFCSSAVFEALKAQGTNIMLNEGKSHLAIDIIPRRENDGLNFSWKPKQMSPLELDDAGAKVKDKAFVVGKSERNDEPKPAMPQKPAQAELSQPPAPPASAEEKKEEVIKIPKEEKINYLIKHLFKIP